MMKSIVELKDRHLGADIWIVAAGPSAGYVDPGFFDHKTTIGVNRVWRDFLVDYLVVKESQVFEAAAREGQRVIGSKHHCGTIGYPLNEAPGEEVYVFDHVDNGLRKVDLSVIAEAQGRIVVSYSTITSAMHVAAWMGAENIILVGHDCGSLDGRLNYEGYPVPLYHQDGFYESFLADIEPQSLAVRQALKETFGCRVYSLNPFLNFGLEGWRYVHLTAHPSPRPGVGEAK